MLPFSAFEFGLSSQYVLMVVFCLVIGPVQYGVTVLYSHDSTKSAQHPARQVQYCTRTVDAADSSQCFYCTRTVACVQNLEFH